MNNIAILKRLEEHLDFYKDNVKNEWLGIFLFGSQNYNLEDEESDIDSRIIAFSKGPLDPMDIVLPNGEHIEILDVYTYFSLLRDMDLQALETLFSKYFLINEKYKILWLQLLDQKELIARMNEKRWVEQLLSRLELNYHRFENQEDPEGKMIQKYGYTPKGAYHTIRQYEMAKKYLLKEPYSKVLQAENRELLIKVKRGYYTQVKTEKLLKEYDKKTRALLQQNLSTGTYLQIEHFVHSCFLKFLRQKGD